MDGDSDRFLRKQRGAVWKMIIQFVCYEYCMEHIQRGDVTDEHFHPKIKSDLLQELVKYKEENSDSLSLYQLLAQFVMRSNKLLEENSFEEEGDVIEECTDLLEELCSLSSNLKPVGQHISSLFENIKVHRSHNSEEEITEWKNVFIGSRMILVKEMLQLLPHPYLLTMVHNSKSSYTLETSYGVTKAVGLLKSINLEERVIHSLKKKLNQDNTLVHIMKKNNSAINHNDQESTTSPDDSYKTAISVSPVSSNQQHIVSQSSTQLNLQKNGKLPTNSCTRENDRKSRLITSTYFATPQPLPKLNIKKQSSWRETVMEMKRQCSPPSSIASSRNQDGLARKRIPWSLTEEELLVLGVEKYNVGKWRLILSDGGLENRTVRDLYDKWKNIQKYGHLDSIKARLRKKQQLKCSK